MNREEYIEEVYDYYMDNEFSSLEDAFDSFYSMRGFGEALTAPGDALVGASGTIGEARVSLAGATGLAAGRIRRTVETPIGMIQDQVHDLRLKQLEMKDKREARRALVGRYNKAEESRHLALRDDLRTDRFVNRTDRELDKAGAARFENSTRITRELDRKAGMIGGMRRRAQRNPGMAKAIGTVAGVAVGAGAAHGIQARWGSKELDRLTEKYENGTITTSEIARMKKLKTKELMITGAGGVAGGIGGFYAGRAMSRR